MYIVFFGVRDGIRTWVESYDGLASNVKLDPKQDTLKFIVNYRCHFGKGFVLKFKGKVCTVDFMTHSGDIFF